MSAIAAPRLNGQGRAVHRTRVVGKQPVTAERPAQVPPENPARWQSIEVRHLAALAAVANEGSFRRAGEELGYVQSAISGQIAHLEKAVGARLLERASGTPLVSLTEAGRVLLRHTEEILARFETAYADVSSVTTRASGVVRVAGLDMFAPPRVAEILSLFRQRHPFARVVLNDSPDGDAEGLLDGTFDLLVHEPPAAQESLTHILLEHDHYVLVVPEFSALMASPSPISAARLAAARPMVPATCTASAALGRQLQELGIAAHPSLAPGSVATAHAFVASGLGTALAPSRLVGAPCAGTTAIPLSHLLAPQTIAVGMVTERSRSVALDGFVRVLEELGASSASTSPHSLPGPRDGESSRSRAA